MNVPEPLTQLLGIGMLWLSVHCVGMCGPLLVGLGVAGGPNVSPLRAAANTVLYQLGRGAVYAVLGATAGLVGAGIDAVLSRGGAWLALAFGVTGIVGALRQTLRPRLQGRTVQIGERRPIAERFVDAMLRPLQPLLASTHPLRPMWVGAALAFLPCMISIWVLGLAATTASPGWGAAVMLTLVAMTTPLLLLVGQAQRLSRHLPAAWVKVLPRALSVVASLWLVLVGLAGLKVIAHEHLPVEVLGHSFVVMLY